MLTLAGYRWSLQDRKYEDAVLLPLVFQDVSRLPEEMRNIDRGQWVRARDQKSLAGRQPLERLAGLERRKGTFQPAEVELDRGWPLFAMLFCDLHGLNPSPERTPKKEKPGRAGLPVETNAKNVTSCR